LKQHLSRISRLLESTNSLGRGDLGIRDAESVGWHR